MNILSRNMVFSLLILQLSLFSTKSFAEGIAAAPAASVSVSGTAPATVSAGNGTAPSAISPPATNITSSTSSGPVFPAATTGTTATPTAASTPPSTIQQQMLQPANESAQNQTPASASKEIAAESSAIEQLMSDGSESEKSSPQRAKFKPLQQFGYSFFRHGTDSFAPLTDIPVGTDYIVGTGDRINVTTWGSIEGNYEFEINRNGEILLPKIGPVKVSGTSFGQLTPLLKGQLAKIYKDFQINVTMGKPRMIKVYLIGQVKVPGDYSISSMSTLINALSAAGGPTRNGTLRNIQIRRNGSVIDTVDLYDFFLKGDKSRDIRMLPGDTIFVPSIGPVTGISGNVRRPAIYELKEEKTLQDILKLADGIIPTGYLQRLQILRVDAHEKKSIADVNLDPATSGKSLETMAATISIKDMDLVRIFPIDNTMRGYVRLDGYVLRPGDYALKQGMKLSDLLTQDNLLPEYHRTTGKIVRLLPPDFHPETILFTPEKAAAKSKEYDLPLQEFDTIQIYSRWELEEMPKVKVSGHVQKPGDYRLMENMTVRDALLLAGNPSMSAYMKQAEIKRYDFSKEIITPYSIYFNLEEAIKGDPKDNILLQKFDEIVVKKWFAREDYPVYISGEVRAPGSFRYVNGMRLRDLILEAGNLKYTAYLENVEITRRKIEGNNVSTFPINVNLEAAMNNDLANNINLEPFDTITVRTIPDWADETQRYIILQGEFRFPGRYPIRKGEKVSSVIKRAGGFTDQAYLRGAHFTRISVKNRQQKHMDETIARLDEQISQQQATLATVASTSDELLAAKAGLAALQSTLSKMKALKAEGRMLLRILPYEQMKGLPDDIELEGGDALYIPMQPVTVSVIGKVFNPTNPLVIPGKSAGYYLAKSGDITSEAESSDIYVVRADGSIESRQQDFWLTSLFGGGLLGKELKPGDTLVVPPRIEKTAWMRDIKDWTTVLAQLAITAGTVLLGIR